ncbi:MAG: hypothetical protein U0452_15510 [Anaerolineae bacterium]
MITPKNWQAEIDETEQVDSLRLVLSELNDTIVSLEESPISDEDPVYDQLHDLELLRAYGELKLNRLLE